MRMMVVMTVCSVCALRYEMVCHSSTMAHHMEHGTEAIPAEQVSEHPRHRS